jgi:hypothetical protein
MKNIFVFMLGFLAVGMLFVGTNVWAAQELTGDTTLTDSGSGPGIDINLSPGVQISYNASSSQFEMCGLNENGTVEYGVSSDTTGVYMHTATLDENDEPVLTTLATTDGSTIEGWNLMGST